MNRDAQHLVGLVAVFLGLVGSYGAASDGPPSSLQLASVALAILGGLLALKTYEPRTHGLGRGR